MLEWMLMPYRRYADFSGRSRRKEYWMFTLLFVIVYAVGFMLMATGAPTVDPVTGEMSEGGGLLSSIGGIFLLLFVLGSFVPALAVMVRRFHDQDKSGWFALLSLIPIVSLVVLVFMCLEGTRGPNQYGPDPKDPGAANTFA